MTETVRVLGIRELASAFRKVDRELPAQLKTRFMTIAEHVAGVARDRATSDFAHPTGKAVSSIKAKASPHGAGIAFGGSVAEYEPWLDFGGRVGRNRSVQRERISGGRYVYPAIASERDETARATEQAISEVARGAGFEVD